jgi:RES domain-containing protein
MDNPLEHWREVIGRQKPHKFSGAFWYRSVYRTRRKSILNMDGALLYGGRYNPPDEFGALYLSDSPEACAEPYSLHRQTCLLDGDLGRTVIE